MGGIGSGRKPTPRLPGEKPKRRGKPKQAETRPCEQCGRIMYIGRPGAKKKYCSLKCKQAAYRTRQKATQPEPAAVEA